jgi:hypothetical protein
LMRKGRGVEGSLMRRARRARSSTKVVAPEGRGGVDKILGGGDTVSLGVESRPGKGHRVPFFVLQHQERGSIAWGACPVPTVEEHSAQAREEGSMCVCIVNKGNERGKGEGRGMRVCLFCAYRRRASRLRRAARREARRQRRARPRGARWRCEVCPRPEGRRGISCYKSRRAAGMYKNKKAAINRRGVGSWRGGGTARMRIKVHA